MAEAFEDSVKLLGIFPEELWLLLLSKVRELDDYERIGNSSMYLHYLLKPDRRHVLFPKAWEVMRIYKHLPSFADRERPDGNAIDKREKWSPEFLALRGVCRFWGHFIDNFYESDLFQCTKYSFAGTVEQERNGYRSAAEFMEFFKESHQGGKRSPFVGANMEIRLNNYDRTNSEEYPGNMNLYASLVCMLITYGHFLNYLTLHFADDCCLDVHTLMKMYSWLKAVPRLPALALQFNWDDVVQTECGACIPKYLTEPSECEQQFPTMPGLQALTLHNAPIPMVNEAVRKNRALRKLYIFSDWYNVYYDIHGVTLPFLRYLHLKMCTPELLLRLRHPDFQSPLAHVHLDFSACQNLAVDSIFDVLGSKWRDTITQATFILPALWRALGRGVDEPGPSGGQPGDPVPLLELPTLELYNLQKLELTMESYTTLDFLLPAKDTLTHLCLKFTLWNSPFISISGEWERVKQAEKRIRFLDEDPLKSNIWEEFPKLTFFYFENWGKDIKWKHNRTDWKEARRLAREAEAQVQMDTAEEQMEEPMQT